MTYSVAHLGAHRTASASKSTKTSFYHSATAAFTAAAAFGEYLSLQRAKKNTYKRPTKPGEQAEGRKKRRQKRKFRGTTGGAESARRRRTLQQVIFRFSMFLPLLLLFIVVCLLLLFVVVVVCCCCFRVCWSLHVRARRNAHKRRKPTTRFCQWPC